MTRAELAGGVRLLLLLLVHGGGAGGVAVDGGAAGRARLGRGGHGGHGGRGGQRRGVAAAAAHGVVDGLRDELGVERVGQVGEGTRAGPVLVAAMVVVVVMVLLLLVELVLLLLLLLLFLLLSRVLEMVLLVRGQAALAVPGRGDRAAPAAGRVVGEAEAVAGGQHVGEAAARAAERCLERRDLSSEKS